MHRGPRGGPARPTWAQPGPAATRTAHAHPWCGCWSPVELAGGLHQSRGQQQQFLFIAFFFVMIFILMSGIFTPSESMPRWAQQFNYVNPVAYLMRINRMVMLKGSGFYDIARDMAALSVLAVTFITFAIMAYRKRA